MKTGTMVEYASERTRVHVLNFNHLYEQIKRNEIDETLAQRDRDAGTICFRTSIIAFMPDTERMALPGSVTSGVMERFFPSTP